MNVLFGAILGPSQIGRICVIDSGVSYSMFEGRNLLKRGKTDLVRLERKLRDLEKLLRKHDQMHWAKIVEGAYKLAQNGDLHCAEKMLGMYGGMGSINDLYLSEDDANLRLDRLLDEIYEISKRIERKRDV